jgi:ribosomal-protein-alanine acetyltransferase
MTPDDIAAVMAIAASLKDAPQWGRSGYEAVFAAAPQRIALVAEAGTVVGFVVAAVVAPEAEIESISVAAEYQRRGVGRRLFAALEVELRRLGCTEILLEVRASNAAAWEMYEGLGFRENGRRAGYYADPVEDGVLMRLGLG